MAVSDSSHQRKVIDALYAQHHRWMTGWLRGQTGCAQQAADLTQDAFMRLLRSQSLPDIHEPRAYLTTLARRVLFSSWRRAELEQHYLQALLARPHGSAPSAERHAMAREAITTIGRWLDGLPARTRRIFLLHRVEGLAQEDIARETGVSLATVERHLRRALIHCLEQRAQEPGA